MVCMLKGDFRFKVVLGSDLPRQFVKHREPTERCYEFFVKQCYEGRVVAFLERPVNERTNDGHTGWQGKTKAEVKIDVHYQRASLRAWIRPAI